MAHLIWLLIPLGALLWRVRGGLINDLTHTANWHGFNDTVVRAVWALGMAGAYAMLGGVFPHYAGAYSAVWMSALLAAALFAGTTLVGWYGADIHLGHLNPREFGLVTLSGVLRMAFVAAALLSPWPLAAGVLCGALYWAGGRLPVYRSWQFWGEIFFGAAIGASFAAGVVI